MRYFIEKENIQCIMKIGKIEVGNMRGCDGREMSTWMQLNTLHLLRMPVCLQAASNIFTNYITSCDVFELEHVGFFPKVLYRF